MPNQIKFSSGSESQALSKGNFYIGTGDVDKGPTSDTDYYNTLTPPDGGYIIYLTSSNNPGNLAYHIANNDSELISFTNDLADTSYTTAEECFLFYNNEDNRILTNREVEASAMNGLIFHADASFIPSYPTTESIWYDISGQGKTGSLENSPTFSISGSGSIVLDGVDDYIYLGADFAYRFVSKNYANGWAAECTFELGGNNEFVLAGAEAFRRRYISLNVTNNTINYVYFNQFAGASATVSITGSTLQTNTPYHLTYAVAPNNVTTFYLNGIQAGQLIPPFGSNNPVYEGSGNYEFPIGFIGGPAGGFQGKYYKSTIYNREIDVFKAFDNYNSIKGRFGIPNIVTDGLVLNLDAGNPYSYLSGSSGDNWKDVAYKGNDGTLINGTSFTRESGSAMVFDGVDDYALIPSSATITPRTGEFTIDSWVNPGNTGSYSPLFVANSNNGIWFGWGNQGSGNNFIIRAYNVANRLEYSTVPVKNQWTNVVGNRVGSTLNLYYNGTPVATSTSTQDFIQSDVYIGSDGYLSSPVLYTGKIATTKYYNTGLSQFEIYQNFNAIKGRYGIPDIVTDGLVLNLDAGNPYSYLSGSSGTTWTDVSGEDNNGTLTNGASYENGAIEFDGTNDWVQTSLLFDKEDFTYAAWFMREGNGGGSVEDNIIDSFESGSNEWARLNVNDGNHAFHIDNDGVKIILSGSAVTLNTWYYSVGVWTKSTGNMKLYVNGQLDAETTHPNKTTITAYNPERIGQIASVASNNSLPSEYFQGKIPVAQVYNRALTSEEITQNFNALRGRYGL